MAFLCKECGVIGSLQVIVVEFWIWFVLILFLHDRKKHKDDSGEKNK